MNWNTIYVRGKNYFEKEVLHNLEHSNVVFMPGSLGGQDNYSLFWHNDKTSLKTFKKAIGAKTIFKYRLQFYCSLDEMNREREKLTTDNLTPQEENMIRKMSDWQEEYQQRYKNSA